MNLKTEPMEHLFFSIIFVLAFYNAIRRQSRRLGKSFMECLEKDSPEFLLWGLILSGMYAIVTIVVLSFL